MPDYDISNAFARIEDELISSMFRNFKHHRAEETKEGFNWEMWQVRQLKALDEYRRANKKIFTKKFASLNSRIDEFIRQARSDGAAEQEIAILDAMKKGYVPKNAFTGTAELAADFIKLNDRKMDALINATTNDLERAEHAMLRMADDQYRKIIFDAQVYAASGAGTYEKAVDMASRDFLRSGINCIEYSNGARHTIRDYVSMVMATTGKRAYLTGEGEMRKQWGESLVIMNKRGNPCPLCSHFVGKVLVDDVWSGGKPDGIHLLMSTAIDKGLYHPRCKDGHTTYFEGISDEGEPYTESERSELIEQYNAEQKSNYAKNQAEKCGRIAKYSLDSENKKVYAKRAEKWREIAEESVDKSGGSAVIPKAKKIDTTPDTIADKKFYKSENLTINPKLKTDVKNGFIDAANQVYERFGRKIAIDKIDIVKSGDTKYRQASYDPLTKTIKLVNSSMSTYEKKAEKFFSDNWNASKDKYGTFYHEIGHAVWEDLSSETKSQISAIYEAKKHEAYLKWMEAGGSSSGMSQTDYFGKTLSRYGATNKNEFFSEAFAQIMSGRMRPVSRQVNQILQEQYASVQLDKNLLDKSAQSGIIKAEIEKGNIKLEINHEKQARHIKGTPEYKEGKSYLTITEEEAQDIINDKSGTGTLVYDRKGNWKKKELIDCDKEVGVDVDENTKNETTTDKATVHYSKTGTHLVPRKEENHD